MPQSLVVPSDKDTGGNGDTFIRSERAVRVDWGCKIKMRWGRSLSHQEGRGGSPSLGGRSQGDAGSTRLFPTSC